MGMGKGKMGMGKDKMYCPGIQWKSKGRRSPLFLSYHSMPFRNFLDAGEGDQMTDRVQGRRLGMIHWD